MTLELFMLRALKFLGSLILHLLVALIGTAMLEHALWKIVPTHSGTAVIWKESIMSILFAVLIGFGMWRMWRSTAGKWIWVPAVGWFALVGIALAGRGYVWGQFVGVGDGSDVRTADLMTFVAFTVPLIRTISYSVGVYVSSRV